MAIAPDGHTPRTQGSHKQKERGKKGPSECPQALKNTKRTVSQTHLPANKLS